MKGLESGKDKVKKICEVLKKETLEPAKREAEEIVEEALSQAKKIIADAHDKAAAIQAEAKKEIERQKNVFQSSLNQACKQSLEYLKQEIENKLFNHELAASLTKQSQDPKVVAELLTAVVKAIEDQGLDSDITAYVSEQVPANVVNGFLAHNILNRLKEKSVQVSSLHGGISVKLHKDNITLDISDVAIRELVAQYIRKDFRELLFASK